MPTKLNKRIFLSFAIPFIFWIYLAFSTQMTIAFDSIGYEQGGKTFKSEGLSGYLKDGPQREPLYAYSISLSMKLADIIGVDYKKILTCLQILLLFLGQVLLYQLLLLLKLNKTITAGALLYYGLSPGIISCGFDLYSEIITLPFILLSILLISKAWQCLLQEDVKKSFLYAFLFSLSATVAVFSKAVLAILYLPLIFPFAIFLIYSLLKGKKKKGQCALIFLVTFFIIFSGSLSGYKHLNKKYNGQYSYTNNRGVFMLYTIASKRTDRLTKELLGVAILSVPGEKVCRAFYGKACNEWLLGSIGLGVKKRGELLGKNISEEEIDREIISASMKLILSNPAQYSFFTFLEGLKMVFWESTKIGFVSYPDWMTKIHDNIIVKNALRLLIGLLTLFAMLYLAGYLLRIPREIYVRADSTGERSQCLLFLFIFVILFAGLYALFSVLVRYSLPIAPLFIAAIAFVANEIFQRTLPVK